ncbi:hypothetical protein JCM3774_001831, partial [Rhodotorula dairenensis]
NKGNKLAAGEGSGHDNVGVRTWINWNPTGENELAQAFKRLSFKTKFGEFKTSENPVLRIVGGPELVTRNPKPSLFHAHPKPRQILVFHPFILVRRTDLVAEPISPEEVPPTESESRVISDAKVVESYAEAEKVAKKTGQGEDPDAAVAEVQEELGTAPRPGVGIAGGENVALAEVAEAEHAEPADIGGKKKKGWFGRW